MWDTTLRTLYQRQLTVLIDELLNVEISKWDDPTPLPQFIFEMLEKSWQLEVHHLFSALLKRFSSLLETTGPFERLDVELVRVLGLLDIAPNEFVFFADVRIRWLLQRGKFTEVENLLEQSWKAAITSELQMQVANRQGVYRKERGEYELSFQYFQQALQLAHLLNRPVLQATIYNNLGNWSFAQNDYLQALEYYEQARQIAEGITSNRILGGATGGIAMALVLLNRKSEAIPFMEMAEGYYRTINFRPGLVRILLNRAYLDAQLGNYKEAKRWCNEAIQLARDLGDLQREATALHNLGFTYAQAGEWENALEFFSQALVQRQELEQSLLTQTTLEEITKVSANIRTDLSLTNENREMLLQRCASLLENFDGLSGGGLRSP